jgi:phosphate starvation-inducible PhoH-like protein
VSQASRSTAATPVIVNFADNRLLSALFGEQDRYLARIEQKLGVSVNPRGNQVVITGEVGARDAARDVLHSLYERLKRGDEVGLGDVDGAIRMAEDEGVAVGNGATAAVPHIRTKKRAIQARTPAQAHYIAELYRQELVFGLGPAGTGKTYIAVAVAVAMMMTGKVDRIVLSRPAVEAGERLGFLPGDMREKVDPYLRPLYDALYDMLPVDEVRRRLDSGDIEVAPLAFMRGRTLANAFVILDEAQNTTPVQMKMLLTRLGERSRMVVTGDLSQIDLPNGQMSGLRDALGKLEGVEGISMVRFSDSDVVRHPLVMRVIRAYAAAEGDLGLAQEPQEPRRRR